MQRLLLVSALLVAVVPVATPASATTVHDAGIAHACGAKDTPETGLQGDVPLADQLSGRVAQGYNCGLSLVSHLVVSGPRFGQNGNGQLAWSGDCAYVATGPGPGGVAVLDVRDPQHPQEVTTLHSVATEATSETMHAVTYKDRAILVTGLYGVSASDRAHTPGFMEVYDVRDCRHPRLLSQFTFPDNIHNLRLTADARTVYATNPLQAVSLADPRKPVFLGNLEAQLAAAEQPVGSHEAIPSPDGKRVYSAAVDGTGGLAVIDVADYPKRPARVVGRLNGNSYGHSINRVTVKGRTYLVNSPESLLFRLAGPCGPSAPPALGPAQAYVTDITDERRPRSVARLALQINDPAHCDAQAQSGVDASTHYTDTVQDGGATFTMAAMWHAGLRLFDMRDPARPREVGYFNPGAAGRYLDQAYSHMRYRPELGQIWLTTWQGGFWVLELEPRLRQQLGLPARATLHPEGAPAQGQVVPKPASANSLPLLAARFVCGVGSSSGAAASAHHGA
jgi:hypothetical protein